MSNEKIKVPSYQRNIGGMIYEPPEKCTGCGADMRPGEVSADGIGSHIMVTLPVPGISLYQCLNCNTVMGNVHAHANLKRQQKMNEKASNLIIPFAKDPGRSKLLM
jgi:hypothetical protein